MHERYDKWYDNLYVKWYDMYASCVVLNDNENRKMLGPHALLYAHALGDTPYPSQ